MRKVLFALLVFLAAASVGAQSYDEEGALLNQGRTYYWTGSAWDRWTGLVTGDWLTDAQLRATPVPVSGTITANQGGTWTVQQGTPPWSVSQSGTWNIGSITNPVAVTQSGSWTGVGVTGTFWPTLAASPLSARLSDGTSFYNALTDTQLRATPVPVSGTVTATTDGIIRDGAGAGQADVLGSAPVGTEQALVVRNIPSGTQPISASSLPLPTGAATEATLATRAASSQFPGALVGGRLDVNVGNTPAVTQSGGPWTTNLTQLAGAAPSATNPFPSRLSDGTSFYNTNTAGQLPAALVGGRLDINLGALGGTAQSGANVVDAGNTAWRVNCVVGCGSSSFADNSTFTFSTTPVAPAGYVVDDTATNSVTENNAGAPRMSPARVAYANLRDASGTEIASSGGVPTNTDQGLVTRPVSYETATQSLNIGTPSANISVSLRGYDTVVLTFGSYSGSPTLQWSLNTVTGSVLGECWAVLNRKRIDGGSISAAAIGYVLNAESLVCPTYGADTGTLTTIVTGTGTVNVTSRLSNNNSAQNLSLSPECDTWANVNVSSATTTLLVSGSSLKYIYICSINLVTAAANNVALISGTGATCGTGTTGMNGGTSAASGWNFAANGGIAQGTGVGFINRTNSRTDSLCVVTSAATQLSGRISYAIRY